jgi:hypothetical protein
VRCWQNTKFERRYESMAIIHFQKLLVSLPFRVSDLYKFWLTINSLNVVKCVILAKAKKARKNTVANFKWLQ